MSSISHKHETRDSKIKRMPEMTSVPETGYPPLCHHPNEDIGCGECGRYIDIEAWTINYPCPMRDYCGEIFACEQDMYDHAHWMHAWCWVCKVPFGSPADVRDHNRVTMHGRRRYDCIVGCNVKFDKPSAMLNHIEGERCALGFSDRISEHCFGHMMIYTAWGDLTDQEKVDDSTKVKVITMPKDSLWIRDPVGKLYDIKRISRPTLVHKVIDPDTGEEKRALRITCFACGQHWNQGTSFTLHMRTGEDDRWVIWKCEDCEKEFEWLSEMMKHYEDEECQEKEEKKVTLEELKLSCLRPKYEKWTCTVGGRPSSAEEAAWKIAMKEMISKNTKSENNGEERLDPAKTLSEKDLRGLMDRFKIV
ncbi:hypothetical protein ABW19_dt0200456 [Dactylella cylindrospora]|nr:hypothetical protein ABW19_dt0200456 [Dactylella cylindrospora]